MGGSPTKAPIDLMVELQSGMPSPNPVCGVVCSHLSPSICDIQSKFVMKTQDCVHMGQPTPTACTSTTKRVNVEILTNGVDLSLCRSCENLRRSTRTRFLYSYIRKFLAPPGFPSVEVSPCHDAATCNRTTTHKPVKINDQQWGAIEKFLM